MSEKEHIDPRRAFIIAFRKLFRHWRKAYFSDKLSIRLALAGAKEKHPLAAEQQRDVDEFLKDEIKVSRRGKQKHKQRVPINVDFDVW